MYMQIPEKANLPSANWSLQMVLTLIPYFKNFVKLTLLKDMLINTLSENELHFYHMAGTKIFNGSPVMLVA